MLLIASSIPIRPLPGSVLEISLKFSMVTEKLFADVSGPNNKTDLSFSLPAEYRETVSNPLAIYLLAKRCKTAFTNF